MAWKEIDLPNLKRIVRVRDDFQRAKKSQTTRELWEDPDFREKMESIFSSEGHRTKKSEIFKKKWEDSDFREKMESIFSSEDYREKLSNSVQRYLQETVDDRRSKFISKSTQLHGSKYDYSKVEYVNNHTKVTIICPEHGEFSMSPDSHSQGRGCQKCGKNYRYTTAEIIAEFRKVHGDRYDYSKVEYVNSKTAVIVICGAHGEFLQSPTKHKGGQGCPQCAGKRRKG